MADTRKPLQLKDIPVMNFGKYVLENMKQFGDAEALIEGSTKKTYTFRDLVNRTERLAAGLQQLGVKKGDTVAIIAPNHLDYPVAFYATTLISAVFQTVNPLFTFDDIRKVLSECNTKCIFTILALVPKIKEALKGLETIQIIVFDASEECIQLESLLSSSSVQYSVPDADWKTTPAVLFSSSGTTGFPKAVQISHYALVANEMQMDRAVTKKENPEPYISFLPMFHIFGLAAVCSTSHCMGYKVVFMSKFNAEEYLSLIQTYRPTTLQVVPPIMVLFAKHPQVNDYDLSSVNRVVCAAAPLSPEIEEAVKNKLNLKYVQQGKIIVNTSQGYGMTETGVTHVNKDDEFRYKSVGKALNLIETKIVDVETGKTLGANEEGELWIRGPQLSLGYHNLPTQTQELSADDGWMRTGDVGKEDEDGFLFIVDRLKELIKYKGYQVAPATLEDVLLRHEAVADVGVIGVPDEESGELPRAYVVKKSGKDCSEDDLKEFVAGSVAPHMKLRGGVEFVTEIPRSLAGKILRKNLREHARLSAK